MGLGALKSAWQRQTKDFGHDRASKYSCLIFDNRGLISVLFRFSLLLSSFSVSHSFLTLRS